MSYARFSYADVYVYLSCYGTLECCGCWLDKTFLTQETAAMLAHLERHSAAGHDVPTETIEALRADAADNDAFMANVAAGMCPGCEGKGTCPQGFGDPHPADCWRCRGANICTECEGRGGDKAWAEAHPASRSRRG